MALRLDRESTCDCEDLEGPRSVFREDVSITRALSQGLGQYALLGFAAHEANVRDVSEERSGFNPPTRLRL
jgi:hypothetical protein